MRSTSMPLPLKEQKRTTPYPAIGSLALPWSRVQRIFNSLPGDHVTLDEDKEALENYLGPKYT